METERLRRRIRFILALFIVALAASGFTAIPLQWEISVLHDLFGDGTVLGTQLPTLAAWLSFVYQGIISVSREYPFIIYGIDWLAFAHIVIAIAFLGPLRDPVRNIWVVEFGMIACVLIVPTALIFGSLRGIPFFWQIIDCSFGVLGIVPLYIVRSDIRHLMVAEQTNIISASRAAETTAKLFIARPIEK